MTDPETRPIILRSPGEGMSRRKQRILLAGGILLVGAVFMVYAGMLWMQLNDDAYITFRFSRYLSMGLGPYFNPGEYVEGYTNFLLMLLMAGVILVVGPASAPVIGKGIGFCCGALVSIWAVPFVFRFLEQKWSFGQRLALAVTAGLFIAMNPAFAINSTNGLETTCFTLLLSAGAWALLEEMKTGRWRGSWILFSLAVLTRPEGAFYFAVLWLANGLVWYLSLENRSWRSLLVNKQARLAIISLVLVAGVFLAHMTFRYLAYEGELLPNTYYAKTGGFASLTPGDYILGHLRHCYAGLVLPVAGLAGLILLGRRAVPLLPLLAFSLSGLLLPFVTGPDWMEGWRLVGPVFPVTVILIICGLAAYVSLLTRYRTQLTVAFMVILTGFMGLNHGENMGWYRFLVNSRSIGYRVGHMALADWLENDAKARGAHSVALMDIGIIGYRCIDMTVIDITGLTDRHIAKSEGGFLNKDESDYILSRHPDYIVLVRAAWGVPYTTPPPLKACSSLPADQSILDNPRFQAEYVLDTPDPETIRTTFGPFAASMGAVRVFEHGMPKRHCYLCVFRRKDISTYSPEASD